MKFSIQPNLENEIVKLIPLQEDDFEKLYAVSSDPAIWLNHPAKRRYEREVFKEFFDGAVESGGAYIIVDKKTDAIIGSTRFYEYNEKDNSILIGYTFYATKYWGMGYNLSVKKMMLDYIFQFVDKVIIRVGSENYRSQGAVEKLGAKKAREIAVLVAGEPARKSIEYEIKKTYEK